MMILENISKSYDHKTVLSSFSCRFDDKRSYLIQGPSGIGKTTLLRIISGLEKADSGNIHFDKRPSFSMVFQEDRLIEDMNAIDNIRFVTPELTKEQCTKELSCLLDPEQLNKPVRELSGGMRRRVCIVRAMLHPSDILLLDEPFAGLDADNRRIALDYIINHQNNRILLLCSHEIDQIDTFEQIRI